MKTKDFITIDEQITLLQSRGLVIEDLSLARQALENYNYYRLSGYSLTLRQNDIFYSGVRLENILEIYCFDSCLRRLILDFSETIEIEMRTHIAYHHGQSHGKLGYLYPENYSDLNYAVTFLKDLDEEIERSKEVFVQHYRDVYNSVFPIWVAIEVISFGDLSRLYANLLPTEKTAIAKQYYGVDKFYVENWLRCTSELRNICAHRGRLYNRPLPSSPNLFSEYKSIDKKMLFAHIIAMNRLLKKEVRIRFVEAFKMIKSQYPFPQMTHLGAPDNWEEILEVVCAK